jgi:hypothetical protein
MSASDPWASASSNAARIQAIVAVFRAAYSVGSGFVSVRLLSEPGMSRVAYVTGPNSHRRSSTYGAACTSCSIRWTPKEYGVSNIVSRMWLSRSSELKPPFDARSQSVHSLSPGVYMAGATSELRYPSERT